MVDVNSLGDFFLRAMKALGIAENVNGLVPTVRLSYWHNCWQALIALYHWRLYVESLLVVKAIHVPLIRALLVQHLYRLIQSTSAWRLERRSHHCGLSFIETISEVVKTLIMIHSSLLTLSCNITCNSNIPLSLECWQYELLINQ